MGSNERAAMAFNAMKAMGISDKRVKPVLKNLLRLYNRKWELIEDENYRVLIEAIFDQEMEDVDEEATKKHKEVGLHEAFPEPPSKKMCLRNRADQASSSAELLLVKREVEEDDLLIPHRDRSAGHEPISSLLHDTEKQKPPTSPLTLPTTEAADPSQQYIQDSAEHNPISPQPRSRDNGKDPILSSQIYSEEIVQCKTQLRAYETECTSTQINHSEKVAPHSRSTSGVCLKEPKVEPGIILLPKEKLSDSRQNNGLIRPKGDTTNDYPPLEVPIATTDPENSKGAINAEGSQHSDIQMPTCLGDGSLNMQGPELAVSEKTFLDGPSRHLNQHADDNSTIERDEEETKFSSSQGLVAVPPQEFTTDGMKPLLDVNDISKGQERVRISVVNEVNSAPYPPLFYYIRWNTVYQSAYLNFSLARIGDDDCCSGCFGDCLSSSIPCACARDTGGEYAYTLEGLVKEKFLDECISMNRDPPKDRHFYCKVCPKEGVSEPCKGHLVRKFIKECWSKCGCSTQCGNRVVQRGIKCNLQVFLTSEGKGWGVRTLEDLPKGTFVCEYVGEVLTNTELYERNLQSTGNEKHTYPVLLDADWGSEGVLKDEEALCLDATYYGNVARFINHRCFDANLVEIPVEVETPDHHYYHLAFFTTRKVEALEELTWDYGIDFEDKNHPVKAFRCCCKSKYCRDTKRPHRTKSRR